MPQKNQFLITSIILGISFIILAGLILQKNIIIFQIDRNIQSILWHSITISQTKFLTSISSFASPTANILLTIILALFLYLHKQRFTAFFIIFIQIGGDALALLFKMLIQRPRPLQQLSPETGFSFPSGHTFCTIILISILLWLVIPKIKNKEHQLITILLCIFWIILIAYSRVYLRDHNFTDIIGSFLLAGSWWAFVQYLLQMIKSNPNNFMTQFFNATHLINQKSNKF